MAFQNGISRITPLLTDMGLNEYQASALSHLLLLGEVKATVLSEASNVPTARIYDILESLSKMGLITKKPGRPTLYKPLPPEDMGRVLMTSQVYKLRKNLDLLGRKTNDFIQAAKTIYLKGVKGATSVPLLRIVGVGEVSLEETRSLYDAAIKEISIISKAMEYFPDVSDSLKAAQNRNVSIRIILMSPHRMTSRERKVQAKVIEIIRKAMGNNIALKVSDEVPIRASIIDPEVDGQAIFFVEDPGVPFSLREAAITSHNSVVKGMALMFNLLWKHRSKTLKE